MIMSINVNIIIRINLFSSQLESKYFEDKGGDFTLT